MDLVAAKKIMKKVEEDYGAVAKEWDVTRAAPRPIQFELTKSIKKGERVLDVGCGNGVLYDVLAPKSIDYVGLDASRRLLRLAAARIKKIKSPRAKVGLMKGNIINLAFRGGQFDWVLALAVLHHLPAPYQKRAVAEMYRVLKPGGRVAVSVWNLYSDYAQEHFKIKEQLEHRPAGWGESDLLTPWKATPGKVFQRYLYRFNKKEFLDLFKKAGFKKIRVRLADASGKWTAEVKKGYNFVLVARK